MTSASNRKTSGNRSKKPVKQSPRPKAEATRKSSGSSRQSKRQMIAILVFAAGLLICALAFISGQNIWNTMHKVLLGLFGVPAYFIGFLVILAAFFYASGRIEGTFHSKVWQLCALFLLICAEVQLLTHPYYADMSMLECMEQTWKFGIEGAGGGLIGGVVGVPIEYAFGWTASSVVVGILIFVLALILTGSTLIGFFKEIAKPVRQLEQGARERSRARKKAEQTSGSPENDMPAHPVSTGKFFVPNLDDSPKKREKKEKPSKKAAADPPEPLAQEIDPAPVSKQQPKLDELVKKAAIDSVEATKTIAPKLTEGNSREGYMFPPATLLKHIAGGVNTDVSGELRSNADRLVDTLRSFGVETRIINICRGPSVTRYELQPSAGVKISKITNLADDIALNLAAGGVRIEAPIPNKAAVGIEVPNRKKDIVSLREIIGSQEFSSAKSALTFALGKDIAGDVVVGDIARMPHVLIAGATGSGKSVCINSLIVSLLYKSSPDDVRLLMIDPKVVELGVYNGIPHLLVPVVTDPRKAAGALGWAVTEMLNRYKLFAETGVRDLKGYNKAAAQGLTNDQGESYSLMPHIVVIIDELADLMMAASREVEDSICRLAQMARAAGMHLVIATQRPSVDVITGVIKANIPSRIAFTVSSQVDSRTILDAGGAEKLLGKGDMLFSPVDQQKPVRIQGCFVSDGEVEKVVEFIKSQETAEYSEDILQEIEKQAAAEKSSDAAGRDSSDQDPMLSSAIEVALEAGQASTSFLQRKLKLGYSRAARIMDEMEARGIVGPQEGSKPREVLISMQQWMEMQMNQDPQE